jgi:hypothetical protein
MAHPGNAHHVQLYYARGWLFVVTPPVYHGHDGNWGEANTYLYTIDPSTGNVLFAQRLNAQAAT